VGFPFFGFFEACPKQVFTEKEKGEKNWRLFGSQKTRFFVPKSSLPFQGEERGGFCLHYRERFLAFLSVFLALSGLHLRLSSSSCSSCEDLLLVVSVQVRVP
jgi:hypothetical protein